MADISPERIAAQRLPLIPQRKRMEGPRRASSLAGQAARDAGNLFWRCAVEVAKVVYTRLDARYPNRATDEAERQAHERWMDEARRILQEHRNDIWEAVLPLFDVYHRQVDEEVGPADQHAFDYFVKNVLTTMVRTYKAHLPLFVHRDEVEAVEQVIDRVAAVQADRLAGMLLNFRFGFRRVVTPAEADKSRG